MSFLFNWFSSLLILLINSVFINSHSSSEWRLFLHVFPLLLTVNLFRVLSINLWSLVLKCVQQRDSCFPSLRYLYELIWTIAIMWCVCDLWQTWNEMLTTSSKCIWLKNARVFACRFFFFFGFTYSQTWRQYHPSSP